METPREWLAVPVGAGVAIVGSVFAVSNLYYASAPDSLLPIDLSGVLLFFWTLGTVLAGGWLLFERPANEYTLRTVAWWGGAMALTLFMATVLLHHQSQQGGRIVSPTGVRINSLSVGSTAGLLLASLDTRAKQGAVALSAEHERLQREQERLSVLNRMVRHDIRNDMAVVLGWSDQLEENANTEQRQMVERIHTASKHVVELTDLSRDYVAVIVDEDSMETKPVDLAAVIRMELETCRAVYPDSEFVVSTDFPSIHVRANELLNSVFRNVLNNAVQHNDTDAPRVEVAVTERGDNVRVAVADNGPGIPDDRKDAVFGKGELGIRSKGTGIGLYLVNVLVAEYGGSVWIEDNDPNGSVVIVELTRLAADQPSPTAWSSNPSRSVT